MLSFGVEPMGFVFRPSITHAQGVKNAISGTVAVIH